MDVLILNPDLSNKTVHTQDNIKIIKTTQLDELAKHKHQWNTLLSKDPYGLPTCSYAWLSAHFGHCLEANQKWLCFFAYHGDELVGVLPLVFYTAKFFSIPYSTYRLPKDNHTIAVCPILQRDKEAEIFEILIKAAWDVHPEALWMEFPDTAENTAINTIIHRHLHTTRSYRIGRHISVNGDQQAYLSSLSRNFRSNQRKAANKLRKLENVETKFILPGTASGRHLSEFMPVEAAGWKGRKGTAILQTDSLVTFYRYLTDELAAAGWLEWHFLYAEDRTIAANLAIRLNRSIVIWKLGYDELYSRCSPGGMLFQGLLEYAFADPDIDEINLLTDAPWYNNWRMENRKYYNFRIYNTRRVRSLIFGYIPNCLLNFAKKCKNLISPPRQVVED